MIPDVKQTEHLLTRWGPVLVFLAAMLWATDAPFRYHLTRELDASFIVLAEHAVNVLLILPFLFRGWSEIRRLNIKQWLAILTVGVGASAIATILFTQAFAYVNPSVAIVLQKLQPLIAVTLAAIFLRERLTKRFFLWAALALAGAYVISFPGLRPELYAGEAWNPNAVGALLALGAAALWGLGTVLGRYLLSSPLPSPPSVALGTSGETLRSHTLNFQTLTALRFLTAFLFLAALNLRSGVWETARALTGKDILFIVIVAVASGFTSLMIYYKGLRHTKASVATFAELGFPFLAVIVNAAALGLFLTPIQLLGLAALAFAVWKLADINRRAPPPQTSPSP